MTCPNCGAPHSYVSGQPRYGETVERTRRCADCGHEWYTTERISGVVEVQAFQAYLWETVWEEHNEKLKGGNHA